MDVIAYLYLAVITACMIAYTMGFQGATIYWGNKIASDNPLLPWGLQDAITPRSQTIRNILMFLLTATTLFSGFFIFRRYVAIGAFILMLIASSILGGFLPNSESPFYRNRILAALQKRKRAYELSGDSVKVEAVDYVLSKFENLNT